MLGEEPDLTTTPENTSHAYIEILSFKVAVSLPEDELGPNVSGKRTQSSGQVDRGIRSCKSTQAITQLVGQALENVLFASDIRFGEEWIERSPPLAMHVVVDGADG